MFASLVLIGASAYGMNLADTARRPNTISSQITSGLLQQSPPPAECLEKGRESMGVWNLTISDEAADLAFDDWNDPDQDDLADYDDDLPPMEDER
jgi:hypothetical protein